MSAMKRIGAPLLVTIAVLAIGVIAALAAVTRSGSKSNARDAAAGSALTVGSSAGTTIPSGFVGLSMEFRGLEDYVGTDPKALDPPFIALLRQIGSGGGVVRIGGDSTDWTWWPVAHVAQPPGVKYSLTPQWMDVARSFASAIHGKLILGVNLEADNRTVTTVEGQAMAARIGRSSIDALEIGNEPELYGALGWYRSAAGQEVLGRPRGYSPTNFISQFSEFSHGLPSVPLAGPSSGAPTWLADLGSFLHSDPRVRLATVHAYPLKHCTKSHVVTIGQLLADSSSNGLANTIAPYIAVAHAHGVALRVDEMNAVTCGGTRGVSDTFASALWATDALFELAKKGVSGVNIQTVPDTINEVLGATLVNGHWQVRVHPEYYGLILFSQAAPAGSRLLSLASTPQVGVKVWGTSGPDNHVRVVVINKHVGAPETVTLRIPPASGPATVEELRAPAINATSGVTLGGQTFGNQTATGTLGAAETTTLNPSSGGTYVVHVPAASATLLTLSKR